MRPQIAPWPFDQPRNCATLTMRQVMSRDEPVLLVSHDLDDHGWQFLGSTPANLSDAMVVTLEEAVAHDSSLLEIADLPPGWQAMRSGPEHPWTRRRSAPDEEE